MCKGACGLILKCGCWGGVLIFVEDLQIKCEGEKNGALFFVTEIIMNLMLGLDV